MNWIIYLAALLAGAANPAQAGANAELRKTLGGSILPAIVVYGSGLVSMLLIQLFVREAWPAGDRFAQTPWWAWLGGILSIASTMAGILLAQRLGSGIFTGINITAALISSVILDHFGLIGFKQHPASLPRILGCALMVGGLWIVSKF